MKKDGELESGDDKYIMETCLRIGPVLFPEQSGKESLKAMNKREREHKRSLKGMKKFMSHEDYRNMFIIFREADEKKLKESAWEKIKDLENNYSIKADDRILKYCDNKNTQLHLFVMDILMFENWKREMICRELKTSDYVSIGDCWGRFHKEKHVVTPLDNFFLRQSGVDDLSRRATPLDVYTKEYNNKHDKSGGLRKRLQRYRNSKPFTELSGKLKRTNVPTKFVVKSNSSVYLSPVLIEEELKVREYMATLVVQLAWRWLRYVGVDDEIAGLYLNGAVESSRYKSFK